MKHAFTAMFLACLLVLPAWAQDEGESKEPPDKSGEIAERCESEYPDDFTLQKLCRENQQEAMENVYAFSQKHDLLTDKEIQQGYEDRDPHAVMLLKCLSDWTDNIGAQFTLVELCLKNQEESWEALQ